MEDIEDLHTDFSPPKDRSSYIVKTRFKPKTPVDTSQILLDNQLPEKSHVFVQTWGCAHNTSDSEYMAGLLANYGYRVTLGGASEAPVTTDACENTQGKCSSCNCDGEDKPVHVDQSDAVMRDKADLWLLNSCTVKGPAEDHFRNAVKAGLQADKRVVVAGCVPQGRPDSDYLSGVSVIGVQQIDRVVEVVEETLKGNTVRFLAKKFDDSTTADNRRPLAGARLDLPKIRRNHLIEILAISTGCLNACTYCKTKHARGHLVSYPINQLLDRAEQAFKDGVKELWLTSEDLGAYGRDLDRKASPLHCPVLTSRWPSHLTLADLLAGLVRLIPDGCALRIGMTNPPYIRDQLAEVAGVLMHPRVYAFIHIPVQSGSDFVLDAMRREYTSQEFCEVVDFLSSNVKRPSSPTSVNNGCGNLTIATDIICGFPNETEADFEETFELVEKYKFPVLFVNQFFARPGTPAAKMPRKATTSEVKQRTRRLHALFRSYRPYENRVGSQVRILITEVSTDRCFWVGHTKAYEQVLVPKSSDVFGRIVLVEIVECDKFFMRGQILDPGPFNCFLSDPVEFCQSEFDKLLPELVKQDTCNGNSSPTEPTTTSSPTTGLTFTAPSRTKRSVVPYDTPWILASILLLVAYVVFRLLI